MSKPTKAVREALKAQDEIRDDERTKHAESIGKSLAGIQARASKRLKK
jgi:hypothetical protein